MAVLLLLFPETVTKHTVAHPWQLLTCQVHSQFIKAGVSQGEEDSQKEKAYTTALRQLEEICDNFFSVDSQVLLSTKLWTTCALQAVP